MAIDFKDFEKSFGRRMNEVVEFANSRAPDIMGVEATNHFKKSFQDQGFTDERLKKWKEVKRRKPQSAWYGHSGQTGRFSGARTNAGILTGETQELRNAISWRRVSGGVRVTNDKPYAAVHNYGGRAMIYGKTPFTMRERQFMGRSAVMKRRIESKLRQEIIKRLTQ